MYISFHLYSTVFRLGLRVRARMFVKTLHRRPLMLPVKMVPFILRNLSKLFCSIITIFRSCILKTQRCPAPQSRRVLCRGASRHGAVLKELLLLSMQVRVSLLLFNRVLRQAYIFIGNIFMLLTAQNIQPMHLLLATRRSCSASVALKRT